MLTQGQLQKLKAELPHGWSARLAERTGFSPNYVSLVLKGKHFNMDIVNEAIKLRDEYRIIKEQLKAKL
jgi:transcriptional regulator with XRE-family HTH domain